MRTPLAAGGSPLPLWVIRTARLRVSVKAPKHRNEEAFEMGVGDKAENKAKEAKGKAKETVGTATDNDRMKREGKSDQTGAKAKNAKEHVKDAAGDVKDAVKK